MSEVTVVTPHLPERREFLLEAACSVDRQTVPVLHRIATDDHGEGPGAMLNRLVAEVETPWYQVLADDDLLDPEHCQILLDNAWAKRGRKWQVADVVFSWPRFLGRETPEFPRPWRAAMTLRREFSGLTGNYMAKRSLWERLGGYDVGAEFEDHDFLCRAIGAGAVFAAVYETTWTYRFHEGSLSERITRELVA